MVFTKGNVANPHGGNAKTNMLARRMMGLTHKAVNALEKTLDDESASHSERLAAAKEVLDRALGRPKQQASISVEHNTSPHLSALIELAASTALRVNEPVTIDVEVTEPKRLSSLEGEDQ